MTKKLTYLFILFTCYVFSQETASQTYSQFVITPEIMAGTMPESNSNFPERSFQKQVLINFGWEQAQNPKEWAQRLKGPRTGISIGYTDFGNREELGGAITAMPFIEFNAFNKKNLKVHVGTGMSYFTKKYDSILNGNNQAISTDLTWSFRVFMYYQLLSTKNIDWRLGAGYYHHSNGHARLPNNGYNSFLLSLSGDIKGRSSMNKRKEVMTKHSFKRSTYNYFSLRTGYGQNVFSLAFNDKQDVYTISGEYGKVYNNTFKIGVGFYYRFYQIYYQYIKNDEFLVRDGREFDHFKENPCWNASNLGVAINGELLLNHIGINVQLGVNFHKPGYKLDWRINQGYDYAPTEIPDYWVYGEFDTKYKMKKTFATRMGLKYYVIGTSKSPKHNIYFGLDINANLGQADFTELSLGYIYSFNFSKDKTE